MPRIMSSAMLAAIEAQQIAPALLLQVTFATATAYMWTGVGNLSWNSQTWLGLGTLLGIEAIEDGATVEARGTAISLSGLDPTILSNCLDEFQLGLPVIVYLGIFWTAMSLIADPIPIWVGRMDQPTVSLDGTSATIVINCENRLLDMNVASDRRVTLQDQILDYPTDLAMQFVQAIQEQTIFWGIGLNGSNV